MTKQEYVDKHDSSVKVFCICYAASAAVAAIALLIVHLTIGLTKEEVLSGWTSPPITGTVINPMALGIVLAVLVLCVVASTIYCINLNDKQVTEALTQWEGEHKK